MTDPPIDRTYNALTGAQIEYLRDKATEFARLHVVPLLGPSLDDNTIPTHKAVAFTDACALLTEAVLAFYLPGSELNDNAVFSDAYDALKPVIRSYTQREVNREDTDRN